MLISFEFIISNAESRIDWTPSTAVLNELSLSIVSKAIRSVSLKNLF